jgi:hypothetical protein
VLRAENQAGRCVTVATPTKLGNDAEAGRSKAQQHALISAFCAKIAGITCSARTVDALNS